MSEKVQANHNCGGPHLTIQDFPVRIFELLQQFSAEELVRRSRPLAYTSDLVGDVFFDQIDETLREPFEKALQEQRQAAKSLQESNELIKKLQEHITMKNTGGVSPHEEFFSKLFVQKKEVIEPPVE